jgi:uncharacterized delta-60 repeat protein
MKKLFLSIAFLVICNFAISQNHAELENSFNINQETNISGGFYRGIDKVWSFSNGSIFVTSPTSSNYYNGLPIKKIAKLTSNGLLDTTFNLAGDFQPLNTSIPVNDIVEQPDGKLIIAGNFSSFNNTNSSNIVRLNPDGTLDSSFSVGTGFNSIVYKLSLQTDGKIIVAGNFTSYNSTSAGRIVRLNSDGSIDTSFITGTGFNNNITDIKLLPDGKMYIAGAFTSYDVTTANRIIRLNENGSIDSNFITGTGFNNSIKSIDVDSTGKVLVAGNFTNYNSISKSFVARINSDGSLDTTFQNVIGNNNISKIRAQSDGKILVLNNFFDSVLRMNNDGSADTSYNDIVNLNIPGTKDFIVLPNGKILLGGDFNIYENRIVNSLTRLENNGSVDSSFSKGIGFDSHVNVTVMQPDGKILVGGNFLHYNNTAVNPIVRLNLDGTIDSSFDLGTNFNAQVLTIELQPDGKIIVGGYFTSFNGNTANYLVRLNSNGSYDISYATTNSLFNNNEPVVNSVALQPDGKLLVGQSNKVKRYNSDGSLDTTFSTITSFGEDVHKIKLLSNGKFYVGSGEYVFSTQTSTIADLRRYNSDGSSDSSFSSVSYNNSVNDIDIQSDGKIIVVGKFTTVSGTSQNRVVRLNTNGTKDTTFNLGAGPSTVVYKVLVGPSDEILIGGFFSQYNGLQKWSIEMLNPDGSKNILFNSGVGLVGSVYSLMYQPDGKILIGGNFRSYNGYVVGGLVRLLGGGFYSLSGQNKLDINNNGCDVTDIPFPNLKFNFNDGSSSYDYFSNTSGNYSFLLNTGTYTITPIVPNTNFSVSPTSITANFPSQFTSLVQNYCLTSSNSTFVDLDVKIIPLYSAVPGFDALYTIVYKNKGISTVSGNVNLNYNNNVLNLVTTFPNYTTATTNSFDWNFTNLAPQEERYIYFTFNLNSPMENPPLNSNDVLNFTATITNLPTEISPNDNVFTLNQTVVNSYDPNDKTCLEGTTVGIEKIGDYVHYLIRFENNGTANAQFIKVIDVIDTSKFDVSTLEPLNSSHSMVTKISETNKVEFFFDNINLPFDDANNDGYVMYKIKLKSNLVEGDSFSNGASIYFDFNLPIITNTATTTITTLKKESFDVVNSFSVYPNPVNDVLNIKKNTDFNIKSISIYNLLGQQMNFNLKTDQSSLDISNLKKGNYILKLETDKGTITNKFSKL